MNRLTQKKYVIPEEENLNSGHLACAGCGETIALRYALKGLGQKTVMVVPACCAAVIDGPFPYSAVNVPLIHIAFATTAATATGVKAGLEALGDTETAVLGWAGDGGTYDIGLQALSGAAERNEDIIFACYDNEAYMNTGIQKSSSTPEGAWTSTTPASSPKKNPKKDIMKILEAHHIPYQAAASVSHPADMVAKFKKARSIKGTKFILIYSPCPTGWKSEPSNSVRIAKLAVLSKIFPLYEVENGKYFLNEISEPVPVSEYFKIQGRFAHLKEEDVKIIEKHIIEKWLVIKEKAEGRVRMY